MSQTAFPTGSYIVPERAACRCPTGRLFVVVVAFALLAVPLAAGAGAVAGELIFLTWPDYIDPDVVLAYENERKVKIRFAYFETDDDRDELLARQDGRGFDLAIVNSPSLPAYRRVGWLSRLSRLEVPNLSHIDRRWLGAVAEAERFAVPYFWGTTGVAYRADLVPEAITHWRQFFEPREELRGKLALIRNSRDVIGMALKALGHSANSVDPAELEAVERLLARQRPSVKTISYLSLQSDSALVTGEVWAAMMYSGDALMIQAYQPEIVFHVPEEGGEIWIDYLVVLAQSSRKALAQDFINFLNRPEQAARNARYVNYATPNRSAEAYLPRAFLENPVIYPPRDVLQRSEFYVDLPPDAIKQRNAIFQRLLYGLATAGGGG